MSELLKKDEARDAHGIGDAAFLPGVGVSARNVDAGVPSDDDGADARHPAVGQGVLSACAHMWQSVAFHQDIGSVCPEVVQAWGAW